MPRQTRQSFVRYPFSEILGNYNHVRIMRQLALHGGAMSMVEIAKWSGVAHQNVVIIVPRLVAMRVVQETGSGRSRLFQIMQTHPVAAAITALFQSEDRRFSSMLQAVRDAAAKVGKGLVAVWLYGSVARGTDAADSDVDIAVVMARHDDEAMIQAFRQELHAAEESLFFPASVVGIDIDDIKRLSAEQDSWWENLARDAVPLVGPDPATLASRMKAV